MRIITLLLVLCSVFNTYAQESNATEKSVTTFYLINNAEKKAPTEEQKDPYLTEAGLARAEKWSNVFKNVSFDAVYSINTISAQQTAQAIAQSQKASLYQFDTTKMYDASFKYLTTGKNILIVGNNETSTKLANQILDKEQYSLIPNDNFGRLYIINVVNTTKNATVLTID